MDLSGLIFVALAIAWAVYLIPKALRHHEDVARARTVDQFSDHLRVLARREPISAKAARLVVSKTRTEAGRTTTGGAAVVETDAPAPAASAPRTATVVLDKPVDLVEEEAPVRRTAPARRSAATRRRRVLLGLLALLVFVGGGVVTHHLATTWLAAPMALLVAWLVACRLMVKGEQRVRRARPAAARPAAPDSAGAADTDAEPMAGYANPRAGYAEPMPSRAESTHDEVEAGLEATGPVAEEVAEEAAQPAPQPAAERPGGLWDPLPMTLPTYVSKSKATRRTVRTIDLDDSDVWTSGRTEVDSALAREADERPPVAPEETSARRASGH